MVKKFIVIVLAIAAFVCAFVPLSRAGTEMVTDNSAQARTYYPPPPRRAPVAYYYAPPPVRIVAYPAFGPRLRVYGYNRWHGRRVFHRLHHRW